MRKINVSHLARFCSCNRREFRAYMRGNKAMSQHYNKSHDLRSEVRMENCDHEWVDCSTAGPDYGDMDMYCKKCGYYFHHILY